MFYETFTYNKKDYLCISNRVFTRRQLFQFECYNTNNIIIIFKNNVFPNNIDISSTR